jgi:hypothetical protein
MSLQITGAERRLTWLDVERLLKQTTSLWTQFPDGVHAIDCFSDGMEIHHTVDATVVDKWMIGIFGHAYESEQRIVRLRIAGGQYPAPRKSW